jgi:uncharacterized protein YecT (DUF1311 family)
MNCIKVSRFICTLSILLSVLSFNSYAARTMEKCQEKLEDTIEYSRCLDGVIEVIDRELQTWVNNQVYILEELAMNTGRTSALSMFRRSQANFIKYREDNCRWQYLAVSPSPDSGPAYKACYIRASKDRIKELSLLNSNI